MLNIATRRTSIARGAVLVGAAVFLLSFGGAIVAAPASLPLLASTAAATPSRRLRIVAVALAALTAAEVGWAATYLTLGEGQPWIVVVPVLAAVGAARGRLPVVPPVTLTRPSLLGLGAAAIAVAVDVLYVTILLAEGEGDTFAFAVIIGIGAVAATAGSFASQPGTRIALLATAGVILTFVGVLGIFSIGLPLLGAAGLAYGGCASTTGSRPPPTTTS